MTKAEQEVVINFNSEDKTASIYTADPAFIRKMDSLAEDYPEAVKILEIYRLRGEVVAKKYECPKKLITVRRPRVISDERREQLRENALRNLVQKN